MSDLVTVQKYAIRENIHKYNLLDIGKLLDASDDSSCLQKLEASLNSVMLTVVSFVPHKR